MAKAKVNGLTQRQENFCLSFVRLGAAHGNASEAYRQSYGCKGSSPDTIARNAYGLLQNTNVKARINELRKNAADAVGLTVEKVLNSLRCAIDFNPRNLYRDDGTLKAPHELDDETASVLAGIEVVEGKDGEDLIYTKKLKWLDKNTARDQAMKHFGLYKRDNEQRTPIEPPMDSQELARVVAFMLAAAAKDKTKRQPA